MSNQKTIQQAVGIEGVGLHTGLPVKLVFKPAPPNHGIKFKRVDLDNEPVIPADVDLVKEVERGTTLEYNGATVVTVEHVLAAVVAMEIDNVLIELDAAETPIMDGSAKPFIDVLEKAGVIEQPEVRQVFKLDTNLHYSDPERGVDIMAVPSNNYQITVLIDFNSPVLGYQHAHFESMKQFREEIADARTFCFLHEVEELVKRNLIKGGSLSNAIVIVDKELSDAELNRLSRYFNVSDVKVAKEGILNNVSLRYQNEPARHKLLDVVGDLALIGTPIHAKIIASRPGHAANIEFARLVKKHIRKVRKSDVPKIDINKPPILDSVQIERNLPHKYPFLFVDKIIELSDTHVVGVKSVTFNEYFFQGHFPGNPVMPGVLQIEALAQTGGILVLNTVDNPEDYDTYFLMINNARFKNKVVPGDTLILKLELLSPIRRGICEMKGTAFVGDKIACEAELMARIYKKEKN